MNILYGVAGEGMGHATRSKVIISHLLKKGHKVHIVASNRAFDFLKKSFPKIKITRIHGLVLVYDNNSINHTKSTLVNMHPKKSLLSFGKVRKIIKDDKIRLIISDNEPTVAYAAGFTKLSPFHKRIPLISIDNIQISSNTAVSVPKQFKKEYLLLKYLNKVIIPPLNVDRFLITTFFYPEIRNKKTDLVPLILRDIVIRTKPKSQNHILVYQTSQSNTGMFNVLKRFKREKFIIYGFNFKKTDENLVFKEFSEKGFVDDLASSKAVITNGGFSLIGEAIFFHKPILSIPVRRHFEQICNAIYLEKKGYGVFCKNLNKRSFNLFLDNISEYKINLKDYNQANNSKTLKKVDEAINSLVK